jgi:hypothetical protein
VADCEHKDLGFDTGYAVELWAMAGDDGERPALPGETIKEFDVLAKEYHTDGCITLHHDESYPTYEQAAAAAKPWAEKWDVDVEDISG